MRQSDAHAWVEVWLEGRGWVRVDPTAAVAPERIELGIGGALADSEALPVLARGEAAGEWRLRLSLAWDSANYYWNYWVVTFGPERQQELLRRMGLERVGLTTLVAGMLALLGALLLTYAAVYAWRARPPRLDPAAALYARFCVKLARRGLPRAASEGPTAYARRAGMLCPEHAAQIDAITELYIGLRYAGKDRSGLDRLREQVRQFRPPPGGKKKPAEAG